MTMRIQKAAEVSGISPESLQRLEREGLIRPLRSRGGHRYYTPEVLAAAKAAFFPAEPKIHTPVAGFRKRTVTVA